MKHPSKVDLALNSAWRLLISMLLLISWKLRQSWDFFSESSSETIPDETPLHVKTYAPHARHRRMSSRRLLAGRPGGRPSFPACQYSAVLHHYPGIPQVGDDASGMSAFVDTPQVEDDADEMHFRPSEFENTARTF